MKTSRYSKPQILAMLRQAEGGVPPLGECCAFACRAKYGGMDASMVGQMKTMDRAIEAPLVQAQWRGRTGA